MTNLIGNLRPEGTFPISIQPAATAEDIIKATVEKHATFNVNFKKGKYILLYRDKTQTDKIPGTGTRFTLEKYKEATGLTYSKITFYMCERSRYIGKNGLL